MRWWMRRAVFTIASWRMTQPITAATICSAAKPQRRAVALRFLRPGRTREARGRREDGRQPNRVDAELLQIGQTLRDPSQITNAVAVSVLKRSRIDLIDDAALLSRSRCMKLIRFEARRRVVVA
jgi:hypothetical protein